MYYIEKIINGKLCFRATPDGDWTPLGNIELTKRIEAKSELLQRSFTIFRAILADSIEENSQDKEIYEILKDADELPVDYVPYWKVSEDDDMELDLIDEFEIAENRFSEAPTTPQRHDQWNNGTETKVYDGEKWISHPLPTDYNQERYENLTETVKNYLDDRKSPLPNGYEEFGDVVVRLQKGGLHGC